MKRKLRLFLLAIVAIFLVTGCTTSKSFTYTVTTGDKIKVELNTTDGYDISSNVPFEISKDGETLSQGTFITLDGYEQYLEAVRSDSNAKVIDNGNKNGATYMFYSYNNSEFNYIIKVNGSNTGILLGNPNSQAEAEEIFSLLTFSEEE